MARNIMVSNKVYGELKKIKGEKSFSEVIAGALETAKPKKTVANLLKHTGSLKNYEEDKEAAEWLRKMWKRWDKRLNQ